MMRRHITFECEGDKLAGTLDFADGPIGLLIVSGGNEVRSGAFGGQSRLARRIADEGFPVFRFDRRGVGDSEGENLGYRQSGPDIAAALATFREKCPKLSRIVAFGNCDAASALALDRGAGCDALILSNPWTLDDDGDDPLPSGDAIRSRYMHKLRDPKEIGRLLSGKVSAGKLFKGLAKAIRTDTHRAKEHDVHRAIAGLHIPATILIAGRDRTGLAFEAEWKGDRQQLLTCDGASHAYVEPQARKWLEERILSVLRN